MSHEVAALAARSLALLLAPALLLRLGAGSPRGRHRIASLSLLALLVLPAATTLLPEIRIGLLPAPRGGERTVAASARGGPAPPVVAPAATAPSVPTTAASTVPRRAADPLALLWAVGAGALLTRATVSRLLLLRLRRRASRPPDRLRLEVGELSRATELRRPVRLVVSDEIDVPSTWGVSRPVLAVPPGFDRWDAGRRRRILLHELAHVAHRDAAWSLVSEAATAVYWWNPLAWYAAGCAREASEGAADARVLAAGVRPSDYAQDLLAVARSLVRPLGAAAFLGSGRGRLRARIEAVLAPPRGGRASLPARLAIAVMTVLLAGASASVVPVEAGLRHRAETFVPRGSGPAAVAASPWRAHQVRWARDGEAGALFLEGDVDLARLVRDGRPPQTDGLLVWFRRGADGSWDSFASGGRGRVHWNGGGRDGVADPEAGSRALAESLSEVAPDWADHPDTSIGSLTALPEVAARPVLDTSGSVILGVPGSSRDPGTGVLQAGWYLDGERIGLFARGPVGLSADGRSLDRLPADGWLAAFGWSPGTGRLRRVEAFPDGEGRPRVRYTEDGVERPFDAAAQAWLGRVLAGLPDREPGASEVSWQG